VIPDDDHVASLFPTVELLKSQDGGARVGRRTSPTSSQAWTLIFSLGYLIVAVSSAAAIWFAFKPFSVGIAVGRSASCGSSVASVYTRRLVPPSFVPCLSEAHRRQGFAVEGAIAAGIVLALVLALTLLRRLLRSKADGSTTAL
jgi:MFS family permease